MVSDVYKKWAKEKEAEETASMPRNKTNNFRGPASEATSEEAYIQSENEAKAQILEYGDSLYTTDPKRANKMLRDQGVELPDAVDKEFTRKANRGQSLFDKNEDKPLFGAFAEGMAAYLPTIVSAAFGGIEGASKGAAITQSLLKSKKLQKELSAEGESGVDIFSPDVSMVDSSTGERVFTTKSGRWVKPDGKGGHVAVNPKNVTQVASASTAVNLAERKNQNIFRAKEAFYKRPENASSKETITTLNSMSDILRDAPFLAKGVIPMKIARGISKEVGPITESDAARAAISKGFLTKIKQDVTGFLTGKVTEEDKSDLLSLVKLLKIKEGARLRKRAAGFSRGNHKLLNTTEDNLNKAMLGELLTDVDEGIKEKDTKVDYKRELDLWKQFKGRKK